MGTVTWRSKTLKRKSDAPNHVGSGDLILPSKPFWVFVSISFRAGKCD